MPAHLRVTLALLTLLMASGPLHAYDPALNLIMPRGGMQGKEVVLHLHGDRLFAPRELLFYQKGITVKHLEKIDDKKLKVTIQIAPDAPLGEHAMRLRCDAGVTYMRTFWVGPFPCIDEAEPNNDFAKPQTISANHTVHGTAGNEDVDYFQIQAKKGQRISAEIEGMRLGSIFFDPYLAILNDKRFELATSDDSPLLRQDAFVSVIAPEDGAYTIMVRESAYEGNDRCRYRLHVGHFPRPRAVYPPAATPGQENKLQLIGDPTGEYAHTLTPEPATEGSIFPLFASNGGLTPPSPNPLLISKLPHINESEPNNWWKNLKQQTIPKAPCALHGIIAERNDSDFFFFRASKGENLRIRARSRDLRSPLDTVLTLRDAKGKYIARNDDQGGPDSIIDFKPPADGEYSIQVRDHLGQGGPDYTYRIEIKPRQAAISATLPVVKRNESQFRKVICIPRGNRYASVVNISRKNHSCVCALDAPSLPQGVRMQASEAAKSSNSLLAVFEASPDAPIAGSLYSLFVRDTEPKNQIRGPLNEVINHIEINNTGVFHHTTSQHIAIAVIEEAPFHVDLLTPPVPIVRNGTSELRIKIRRQDGFDAPVKVTLPWKPSGVGAPTSITIAKGKSEAVYAINANADATLGTHQICVSAEAKTPKGTVLTSSSLVPLSIREPFISAKLEMASTIPGQAVSMLCKIEHPHPIQGQAEIRLLGLPHGVKASPRHINNQSKEVIFDLEVAHDAAKGNHNSLFCQVLPKQNGHAIPHQTAQGGSLRINPPPPVKKSTKPGQKPAAVKKPAANKPLSRLEQLRQRNQ
ncbi:PPC domain-containing protein [Verrucomicrobiaceae bacterium N1E253]|uniref:PPC domain-containing protein n=1 Tax=Oceaniferula marina TaxID=2748318 RepID=A0A851GM98_9BACT|nr:PPC domain-containing protein [Oceaniferula marina]NWK55930.1 PPC domain-containing protein [Oceaniferula marina]